MAAGRLVFSNWMPALDADGVPIPNAQMFFYANRTTTLATVYADEALTTPLANPVLADSSGQFVPIWADITLLFSAAVASTTLGQFDTIDDLAPSTTVGGAANKLDRDGGNPEPDFLENVGAAERNVDRMLDASIAVTLQQALLETPYAPVEFGVPQMANAGSKVDATAQLQAMIDDMLPGLPATNLRGKFYVNHTLYLKPGVCLQGGAALGRPVDYFTDDFFGYWGMIVLGPNGRIVGLEANGCGLDRVVVIGEDSVGMRPDSEPEVAAVVDKWWTDGVTALTFINSHDVTLNNCLVVGFKRAALFTGCERPVLDMFRCDTHHGVDIRSLLDVGRVDRLHSWGFWVVGSGYSFALTKRKGIALRLGERVDGVLCSSALTYGHIKGVNTDGRQWIKGTVSNAGAGYTSAPTVSITTAAFTGATAYAVLNQSQGVAAIVIDEPGTVVKPTVGFSGGGGTGATAVASITYDPYTVSVRVTNPGSGYATPPTVTVTGAGTSGITATASVAGGLVTSVTVTNSGTQAAPTIALTGGGGTGASITGSIEPGDIYASRFEGFWLDNAISLTSTGHNAIGLHTQGRNRRLKFVNFHIDAHWDAVVWEHQNDTIGNVKDVDLDIGITARYRRRFVSGSGFSQGFDSGGDFGMLGEETNVFGAECGNWSFGLQNDQSARPLFKFEPGFDRTRIRWTCGYNSPQFNPYEWATTIVTVLGANQSVAAAGTELVEFDEKPVDSLGEFDATALRHLFKPQVAGAYDFDLTFSFLPTGNGYNEIILYKKPSGGMSSDPYRRLWRGTESTGNVQSGTLGWTEFCNAGDEFQIVVQSEGGCTLPEPSGDLPFWQLKIYRMPQGRG